MTFPPNTTIGPYTILRELGRGGMGVVYLARDTRLDREVAIKALPEHLAADPDRLARFEREAKTLAQLSHPNVASIYGVEEQDGRRYLVLEYVEGETLADRIRRGRIPIDDAIELAVQIASGVEAAHEAGVIHRDLKPDNIRITPDGKVKVLDFGLARSEAVAHGSDLDSPTVTSPKFSPTIPGAIMGTAGYMSPEQARGRAVDRRTDLFSFGCLLFEMLTGAPTFAGESVADAVGATLHKEADFSTLPSEVPGRVQDLLVLCLEKDRRRRLRDFGDAAGILRLALEGRAWAVEGVGTTPWVGRGRWRHVWMLWPGVAGCGLGIGLVGALSLALGWSGGAGDDAEVPEPVRLVIPSSSSESGYRRARGAVISPDGRSIVFQADRMRGEGTSLWLRRLSSFEAEEIAGTEGGSQPFWSWDIGPSRNLAQPLRTHAQRPNNPRPNPNRNRKNPSVRPPLIGGPNGGGHRRCSDATGDIARLRRVEPPVVRGIQSGPLGRRSPASATPNVSRSNTLRARPKSGYFARARSGQSDPPGSL